MSASVSSVAKASAQLRTQAPGFHRCRVGAFEITALHDGFAPRALADGHIANASLDEVKRVLASRRMSTAFIGGNYTCIAVNTGRELLLVDAGMGEMGPPAAGRLLANMAAAGLKPDDVGLVVISHFHGDHIQGLRAKSGALNFPNAKIAVPEGEWDYWMDDARMNAAPEAARASFEGVRRVFAPVASEVRRFSASDEIVPGVTAMPTPGHSPGHTSFLIESDGQKLIVVGDVCNDPRIFAHRPDFQLGFDMDKPKAEATRRALLDKASADGTLLAFYHAPFPGLGHVAKAGDGYDWFPLAYDPNA